MSTAADMDSSQQEPTMEEILASIRRIISEDDEQPAEGDAPADAAPSLEAVAEEMAEPEADEDDGVLELTQKIDDDGDIEAVETAPEPEPEPEPVEAAAVDDIVFEEEAPAAPAAAAPAVDLDDDSLMEETTRSAAASSFAALSGALPIYDGEAKTLEEVVQAMLRPMLKQWLDENLPQIVEAKVQEEIERVARRQRGR